MAVAKGKVYVGTLGLLNSIYGETLHKAITTTHKSVIRSNNSENVVLIDIKPNPTTGY